MNPIISVGWNWYQKNNTFAINNSNVRKVSMLVTNNCDPDPRVLRMGVWLVGAGYDVTIYAYDRMQESEKASITQGVKILRFQHGKSPYGGTIKTIIGKRRFLKFAIKEISKSPPEIVFCHDGDTLQAGAFLKKKLNIPLVLDMHDLHFSWTRMNNPRSLPRRLVSKYQQKQFERLLVKPDLIFTSSGSLPNGKFPGFKQWIKQRGMDSVVIENRPQESQKTPKKNNERETVVSYIGKIRDEEAMNFLISSVLKLRDLSKIKLLIAGDGVLSGKIEKMLIQYHEEVGLDYEFHGRFNVEQKYKLIAKSDVMFAMYNPKRGNINEGALPTKMFDAASIGIPTIVNSDCLMGEIIEKEGWGFSVEWGNFKSLRDAILSAKKYPKIEFKPKLIKNQFLEAMKSLD